MAGGCSFIKFISNDYSKDELPSCVKYNILIIKKLSKQIHFLYKI